jgi:hypothetical protein
VHAVASRGGALGCQCHLLPTRPQQPVSFEPTLPTNDVDSAVHYSGITAVCIMLMMCACVCSLRLVQGLHMCSVVCVCGWVGGRQVHHVLLPFASRMVLVACAALT